jgi:DNA-binding transcriptional MocR family regulator
MRRHAALIRPKFEIVLSALENELGDTGIASWTRPRGGYFISLDVFPGTASGVISMAADTGVMLTPAGSTWPYHNDPQDKNIRIAPTFPSEREIAHAADILCICTKIAAIDKIIEK